MKRSIPCVIGVDLRRISSNNAILNTLVAGWMWQKDDHNSQERAQRERERKSHTKSKRALGGCLLI